LEDYDKVIVDDKLTQADLIKLLLHNAQHMATRDEVKADINKLEDKISKVEIALKVDINKVETALKVDINKVEISLKSEIGKLEDKISKVDGKFDKIQWLIVATILTVLLKDYIFSFLK
jgi:hypothetical protein